LPDKSISLDANFSAAYGVALACYAELWDQLWMDDERIAAEGKEYALRAAQLGLDDAFALSRAALFFCTVLRDAGTAEAIVDQAIAINPIFPTLGAFVAISACTSVNMSMP
jgi:hypothetical protein